MLWTTGPCTWRLYNVALTSHYVNATSCARWVRMGVRSGSRCTQTHGPSMLENGLYCIYRQRWSRSASAFRASILIFVDRSIHSILQADNGGLDQMGRLIWTSDVSIGRKGRFLLRNMISWFNDLMGFFLTDKIVTSSSSVPFMKALDLNLNHTRRTRCAIS